MTEYTKQDREFLALAVVEARRGLASGGIPIGSVLVRGDHEAAREE